MKKVEVRVKHEVDQHGKKIPFDSVFYRYCFTDEEKDQIKQELKRKKKEINSAEIHRFINHLEYLCQAMKLIQQNPKDSHCRIMQEEVLKNCKKALRQLQNISRGRLLLAPSTYVAELTHPGSENMEFLMQSMKKAWEAEGPLESFVKLVEESLHKQKPQIGRKRADLTGFIKEIAMIYLKHLHKIPTSYEDGPFVGIVKIAHEALDLSFKDPSRGIRNALKGLQKEREERGYITTTKLLEESWQPK